MLKRKICRSGLRSVIMSLILACAVPAHAQIYLHSEREQKITDALAEQLEKAQIAHLGALDAHRDYLTEQLARERTLIIRRALAERDMFLALTLNAPDRGPGNKVVLLRRSITDDWIALTGQTRLPADVANVRSVGFDVQQHERRLTARQADLALYRAEFEREGGKATYCDSDNGFTFAPSVTPPGARLVGEAIRGTCGELKKITGKISDAFGTADSTLQALLGRDAGGAGGTLDMAINETREIATLITAQKALTTAITAQLKALDKYYQCQLKLTKSGVEVEVSERAKELQKLLDELSKGDANTTFSDATFDGFWKKLTAALPDSSACTENPGSDKKPDAPIKQPTEDALKPADVLAAIKALDRYALGDALLGAIRSAASSVQASSLADALDGLATVDQVDQESSTARAAAAALRLAGHAQTLALAWQGKLPDTAGVLVALAEVRMREATAKIETDRLNEQQRLSILRLAALRQQGLLLAKAAEALPQGSGLDRGLLLYAASWNQGAIPAAVAKHNMTNGRYLPWVARERAVVEATYAMLKPGVAELQAWGQGGLKAETIAQYLQAFGLGAIAVK